MFDQMPNPNNLVDDPELAILLTLDTALEMTIAALAAVHSEIYCDDVPAMDNPDASLAWIAHAIVGEANALLGSLDNYRQAVEYKNQAALARINNRKSDTDPFI